MASDDSDDVICPECGQVMRAGALECPGCGRRMGTAGGYRRDRAAARFGFLEPLRPVIWVALVVGVLGLIGYGVYYAGHRIWQNTVETSPYPEAPQETTREFFTQLAGGTDENYQECYNLLVPQRKAATVIGKQSRGEGYFPHFERIRRYLVRYAGKDFAQTMEVTEDGRKVEFAGGVVLTVELEGQKGLDGKTRYALREINEFPIDVAPGIGLEKHYRGVNRAIETMGASTGGNEDASASEIIRRYDYENRGERMRRLIKGFKNARQLDTRQTVLEWIIKEFPNEPATRRLLEEVAKGEGSPPYPPNLQQLAKDTLAYWGDTGRRRRR